MEEAKEEEVYPIYFTQAESEAIAERSTIVYNKLEFVLKGTSVTAAVGVLSDENLGVPTNVNDEISGTSIDDVPLVDERFELLYQNL